MFYSLESEFYFSMAEPTEKPSVYLESSVISYLTNRLSSDLVVAGHQKVTLEWWSRRRNEFALVLSEIVLKEIRAGGPEASSRREQMVQGLEVLRVNQEAEYLTQLFLERNVIPAKAENDALHLSLVVINGIDVLLTWNCKHIANIQVQKSVRYLCEELGYEAPEICTPLEISGE